MGHVDERDPDLLLDPLELDLHLLAQLEVQRPERFVEQEDGGLVDQRPGERDALRLAARDLGRLARLVPGQLDQGEHLGDPALDLGILGALAAEAECDVLEDREVREERVVLEDGVDVALVGRQPGHVLALELDQARGRCLEATDHPQGRRLAAPRRPEQAEELTVADLEVDVVDGDRLAELLDHIHELDVDRWQRSPPAGGPRPPPSRGSGAATRYGRARWVSRKRGSRLRARGWCEIRGFPLRGRWNPCGSAGLRVRRRRARGRGTISTLSPSEHRDHVV